MLSQCVNYVKRNVFLNQFRRPDSGLIMSTTSAYEDMRKLNPKWMLLRNCLFRVRPSLEEEKDKEITTNKYK